METCGVTEKTRRRSTASSSSTAMIRCASTLVRCALPDMIPAPPASGCFKDLPAPSTPRSHSLPAEDGLSSSPWQRVLWFRSASTSQRLWLKIGKGKKSRMST